MAKHLAGCYLRVSSTDGRQTVENQRQEVSRLAEARGYEVAFYEEHGSAVKRRPVLERLMEDARRGVVRAVVVVALDRLDRDQAACLARLTELDHVGCAVISVREAWLDTSAPQLRGLLAGIFSWMAEMERATLIERTKAGIARARRHGTKSGKPIGRPSVMLPRDLERAKEMRAAGRKWTDIGAALGVNPDTVRLALG